MHPLELPSIRAGVDSAARQRGRSGAGGGRGWRSGRGRGRGGRGGRGLGAGGARLGGGRAAAGAARHTGARR